jgi:hypothetical protein
MTEQACERKKQELFVITYAGNEVKTYTMDERDSDADAIRKALTTFEQQYPDVASIAKVLVYRLTTHTAVGTHIQATRTGVTCRRRIVIVIA